MLSKGNACWREKRALFLRVKFRQGCRFSRLIKTILDVQGGWAITANVIFVGGPANPSQVIFDGTSSIGSITVQKGRVYNIL